MNVQIARRHLPEGRLFVWLALPIVLLAAAGLRALVLETVDLRDLPGPGGVQFLFLAIDPHQHDLPLPAAILRTFAAWTGLHPVAASRLLTVGSSVAAVLGAMLAAGALGGKRAALLAGAIAAFWSQHLYQAILLGMDAPAAGLSWLGLGLAWVGARLRWPGLPLTALGAAMVLVAATLKPVALPSAALLLVLPALHGRDWKQALASCGAAVLGGLGGFWLMLGATTAAPAVQASAVGPGDLVSGFTRLLELRQATPDGALTELLVLALVCALLPGKRWVARLLLMAATIAILALSAASLGDWLRVRYLVPSCLGVAVLGGWGLARLFELLPRFRWLGWVPPAAIVALLLLDTLAFFHAWSDLRTPWVGTAACTLPRPPAAWARRYQRLTFDGSTSTAGALDLMGMVFEGPPEGIAVVKLQDGREAHAQAAAALAGVPAVLLDPQRCCDDGEHSTICAQRLLRELNDAGALVVLLPQGADPARIPRDSWDLTNQLRYQAARDYALQPRGDWWASFAGQASGGVLPCR